MSFRIPFFRHDLGEPELQAVGEVFASPILTTGQTVATFEARFADLLGCRHALAVTSCTGALHLSLLALDIGPGDEVITTPMTFIATANAIMEAGATPVFVDVEPDTGNLDAALVEQAITPRTRAILPVHLYGQMCDMNALRALARAHGLALIEDAAHCVEGVREGFRPGQTGTTACFSFYATKNLTCGEGGALVTNDTALYEKLRLLRLHGMTATGAERAEKGYRHWDMTVMGWKYNMSNIEAAILLPQMQRIPANLERRHRLARLYEERLAAMKGIRCFVTRPDTTHARHLFPILVDAIPRDAMIQVLQESGVGVAVNYRPVHLTRYMRETFGYRPGRFPVAEAIGERVLSLPFFPHMPPEMVHQVCDIIAEAL